MADSLKTIFNGLKATFNAQTAGAKTECSSNPYGAVGLIRSVEIENRGGIVQVQDYYHDMTGVNGTNTCYLVAVDGKLQGVCEGDGFAITQSSTPGHQLVTTANPVNTSPICAADPFQALADVLNGVKK